MGMNEATCASAVLDPGAFKAYDIRGIYRQHLNEEGFCLIGSAFQRSESSRRTRHSHSGGYE